MTALTRLLKRDLTKLSELELINGIQQAESIGDAAPEWSGRLLAALHAVGRSWPEIAILTGVSQTTAYRRAERYL